MNSQTKIVVIRMKWLIIAVIAAIVLIAGIVLYFNMGKNDSGSSSGNARTTSTNVKSAADTDSSDVRNSTYKNSPVTYTPGVYTASIMLDGNPVDIKVTLDKNNINNIELVNLSDSVTTMYPMLNDNFEEIASAVKINGITQNITYSADSKYTSSMILSGIKAALDKAVVTGAK